MIAEYMENHTKSRFSHQKYRLWPMPNSLRSSGRVLKTAPENESARQQCSQLAGRHAGNLGQRGRGGQEG